MKWALNEWSRSVLSRDAIKLFLIKEKRIFDLFLLIGWSVLIASTGTDEGAYYWFCVVLFGLPTLVVPILWIKKVPNYLVAIYCLCGIACVIFGYPHLSQIISRISHRGALVEPP